MDIGKLLITCCQTGNYNDLQNLLHTGMLNFDLNSVHPDVSLLILCVQGSKKYTQSTSSSGLDHSATCVLLVQGGVDANFQDIDGRTALHWAVLLKNPYLVAKLIELGADPYLQDNNGLNVCQLSVRMDRSQCLVALAEGYSYNQILEEPDTFGTPPLILAARARNAEICHILAERGVNVDAQDTRAGRTALHYAAMAKCLELFKVLIRYKASVDIPDNKSETVLQRICRTSDSSYLMTAMANTTKRKLNLNMLNSDGLTVLMVACQNGNVDHVNILLQQKGVKANIKDRTGRTALHYCSDEKKGTGCAVLILKADKSVINIQDDQGFSSLHLAVIAGNAELIELLLKKGANVNCLDCERHTVMHWATVCNQPEVMERLLTAGAKISTPDVHNAYPLHYASQLAVNTQSDGDGSGILRLLLDKGVSVHVLDKDQRQPLLWASSAGSAATCLVLIHAGAEVDAVDKDGLTALHCAASRGYTECVNCLLQECQASPDIQDKNGCTPLFYAITREHEACAETLLSYKANPNHQDERGRSPAHCAALKGSEACLKLLEKHGSNMWLPATNGDYPVHEAAHSMKNETVQYLLERAQGIEQSNFNVNNKDGRTCLHIAALTNNKSLCKTLIDRGAKINAIMEHQEGHYTAYDAAVLKGNTDTSEYLTSVGGITATEVRENAAIVIQRTVRRTSLRSKNRDCDKSTESLKDLPDDPSASQQPCTNSPCSSTNNVEKDGSAVLDDLLLADSLNNNNNNNDLPCDNKNNSTPDNCDIAIVAIVSNADTVDRAAVTDTEEDKLVGASATVHSKDGSDIESDVEESQGNSEDLDISSDMGIIFSKFRRSKVKADGDSQGTVSGTDESTAPGDDSVDGDLSALENGTTKRNRGAKGRSEKATKANTRTYYGANRHKHPRYTNKTSSSGKKLKGSQKILEDVQTSVRRFNDDRQTVKQLQHLRRAQIYTGPISDVLLFKRLLESYQESSSKDSTGIQDDSFQSHQSRFVDNNFLDKMKSLSGQDEGSAGDQQVGGKHETNDITDIVERTERLFKNISSTANESLHNARTLNMQLRDDMNREPESREQRAALVVKQSDSQNTSYDVYSVKDPRKHSKKADDVHKQLLQAYRPAKPHPHYPHSKGTWKSRSFHTALNSYATDSKRSQAHSYTEDNSSRLRSRSISGSCSSNAKDSSGSGYTTVITRYGMQKLRLPAAQRPTTSWYTYINGRGKARTGLVFLEPSVYEQKLRDERARIGHVSSSLRSGDGRRSEMSKSHSSPSIRSCPSSCVSRTEHSSGSSDDG